MQNIRQTSMNANIVNTIFAQLKSATTDFNMIDKYDNNSIYALEEMASTNDDYILIKKCFEGTTSNVPEAITSKIYRVVRCGSGETSERKSDNLMFFHGTSSKNAIEILDKGFKPTIQGKNGHGVYLTEFASCAVSFAGWKIVKNILRNADMDDNLLFIFVNEILQSEKLEDLNNFYVCHEQFVIPRYLIQCFPTFN